MELQVWWWRRERERKDELPILCHRNRQQTMSVKLLPLLRNLFQLSFTFFNLISFSPFSSFFFPFCSAPLQKHPTDLSTKLPSSSPSDGCHVDLSILSVSLLGAGGDAECALVLTAFCSCLLCLLFPQHSDPLLSIRRDKWGQVLISQLNGARSTKQRKTRPGPHNSWMRPGPHNGTWYL